VHKQVPVTASGFPEDVTQFVQRLASELTDLSPVGSSAELAQRALRDACKKELQVRTHKQLLGTHPCWKAKINA